MDTIRVSFQPQPSTTNTYIFLGTYEPPETVYAARPQISMVPGSNRRHFELNLTFGYHLFIVFLPTIDSEF